MLAHKRVEKIEVIPNTYMFFKVVTKDMLAPGKINFAFGEGQYVRARRNSNLATSDEIPSPKRRVPRQKVELSVYFSCNDKNREPTKENCDKAVESPSGSITMPNEGKERFSNDEVYLSLYSITGCTVLLTPTFPDLKIMNYSRKQTKEDCVDDQDFTSFLVCQKWQELNKERGADKDSFIREHITKVGDFASYQARRAHYLAEKRDISVQMQTRQKREIDEFDYKMKYFKLHRWNIIKHHREVKEAEAKVRLSIKKRAKQLIKLGLTFLTMRNIYQRFAVHR